MTDRTSVWYFVPALSYGGAERTLVDLANGLDHDRYDVTVWTIFEQNPLAELLDDAVTLRTLGIDGKTPGDDDHYVTGARDPTGYVEAPIRFLLAVRAARPDVLQSFLLFDNVIARLAGRVSPGTTVVSGVRSVETDPPLARRLLDRATLPLADHVVSNSQSGAERAVERGVPPERVDVIWNGRDIDRYRSGDPAGLHEEFDIPETAPVVGTVGRLIERKGHHDLVAAWPAVVERFPDARLLIVGDGPQRGRLRKQATDLGCSDRVVLTGMRDDVPALLALFDVFVLPSYFEGLPGALIEAMGAERPIVTTPVDGSGELVGNYQHGLHVDVGAPAEVAWAVIRLLETPELADSLGRRAGERAEDECTVEGMVGRFESLYDRLTGT
jgi:glycosyltransferase involved in cell wall biosynthesis